jgi:hypothetical protein
MDAQTLAADRVKGKASHPARLHFIAQRTATTSFHGNR